MHACMYAYSVCNTIYDVYAKWFLLLLLLLLILLLLPAPDNTAGAQSFLLKYTYTHSRSGSLCTHAEADTVCHLIARATNSGVIRLTHLQRQRRQRSRLVYVIYNRNPQNHLAQFAIHVFYVLEFCAFWTSATSMLLTGIRDM
jgi:hypothetical protein